MTKEDIKYRIVKAYSFLDKRDRYYIEVLKKFLWSKYWEDYNRFSNYRTFEEAEEIVLRLENGTLIEVVREYIKGVRV